MARRRVFRTRVLCPGIDQDLSPTANQRAMRERVVTMEKHPDSGINLLLDGTVIGSLDTPTATKVAAALDGGQTFSAVIEKALPHIVDTGRPSGKGKFKCDGGYLDIKVEYLWEKGTPAVETERNWRCAIYPEVPEATQSPKSFFTKIAGVTFEGRQRIVARCSVGERLLLVRDPKTCFDTGAIKVMRLNGEQIGFLPSQVSRGWHSSGLASSMDRGNAYHCRISSLTGGNGKTLGVNIEILDADESGTPETATVTSQPSAPDTLSWLWALGIVALIGIVIAVAMSGAK